jgi:hypothetical protein
MRRGRRRRRRLRSFDSRLRISRLRGEDNAPSRSTGGGGGEEEGRRRRRWRRKKGCK